MFSGEKMYEMKTENVCAVLIVNPRCHTAVRKIQSFLSAECGYRYLLHAGLVFQETGNWILQDGPLTFSTFSSLFRGGPCNGTGPIDLTVSTSGEWNVSNIGRLVSGSRVRIPCSTVEGAENLEMWKLAEEVSRQLDPGTVMENLMATDIVGNVSFAKPTMYIFSGGEGSSSVFCVKGCKILVDGGFGRRCCFWSLLRHFEEIDVVLLTSLSEENILGISAFLERKVLEDAHPRIGPVFVNAHCTAKDVAHFVKVPENSDKLCVSLAEESATLMERLQKLNIEPRRCFVSSHGNDRINLFNLITYGSLDMYVLSPVVDSKEWKEFVDRKSTASAAAGQISVCAVVVFQPAGSRTCPTRVLFCGSCSQSKILSGCDRLKMLHLFQTVSGLPEERPRRPSSVSTQEKMSVVPASKPCIPSVGTASSSSRASETKKFSVVHVKEPASNVVSSEPSTSKTVSKELPKPTHRVDASKKPVKKPPHEEKGVNTQTFPKEIRQPVSGRSHDFKGSTSTKGPKGTSAKPSASKSEAAVGTVLVKTKKPGTSGRPKMLAKHGSELQTSIAQAAADTVADKTCDKVKVMVAAAAAESNVDERHIEADATSDQQQSKVSCTPTVGSTDAELPTEMDTAFQDAEISTKHSADAELPTEMDRTFQDAEITTKHESLGATAALEHVELDAVSSEVAAKLPLETDAPLLDAEMSKKHESVGAVAAVEQAELLGVNSVASVSKQEPEADMDEKDIDTAETELDSLASEVVSGVRESENRCDEKAAADENILLSAADLQVKKAEENAIDGMTDRCGMEQSCVDVKDEVAAYVTPDQPDDSVDIPDVGPGSIDAEYAFTKVADLNGDEYLKRCASGDEPYHSDTSELKHTEPTISLVLAADDAESKNGRRQNTSEAAESAVRRTRSMDEDSSTSKDAESQQDVVADTDIRVQEPTGMDERDVPGTEKPASDLVKDNSEVPESDANSDGKPFEEILRDNAIEEGADMLDIQKSAGACAQDCSSQSKVLEDNSNGKPVGEEPPVDGLSEFDPQRDWESPQSLPTPANGKDDKFALNTKSSAATAGTFKVPALKPKRATTYQDDINVTGSAATSSSVDRRTRGRLSLQPGELHLLSPVGQQKTSPKPVIPFHVDLVSLPVSASGACTVDVDFFRRIRAQYYIVNSSLPHPQVLEFLAAAKATWESPMGSVTVIPTGNPTLLLEWYSSHHEQMTALQISVSSPASQSVVELQGTSCNAYRLEL